MNVAALPHHTSASRYFNPDANLFLAMRRTAAAKCAMRHAWMNDLLLTWRVVIFVVAVATFYLACFLYEGEEGRWQNRIENLWIAIDDRAHKTDSKPTAFFNKVAEVVSVGFDRLFGPKLVSFQSIGVSIAYSLGGALTIAWLLVLNVEHRKIPLQEHGLHQPFVYLVLSVLCFLCALLSAWYRRAPLVPVAWIPLLALCARLIFYKRRDLSLGDDVAILIILVLSTISDIVLILLVRRTLAKVATQMKITRVLLLIAIQAFYTCILSVVPWEAVNLIADKYIVIGGIIAGLTLLNASTVLISLVPLTVLAGVLLHAIFWPVVSRLVYALARHRIISNRKWLITVSALSFGYAFGAESKLLAGVIKLFAGSE